MSTVLYTTHWFHQHLTAPSLSTHLPYLTCVGSQTHSYLGNRMVIRRWVLLSLSTGVTEWSGAVEDIFLTCWLSTGWSDWSWSLPHLRGGHHWPHQRPGIHRGAEPQGDDGHWWLSPHLTGQVPPQCHTILCGTPASVSATSWIAWCAVCCMAPNNWWQQRECSWI